MRKLKLIAVLIFLNLVNFSLSAHNLYKSGYIINLKGDTIKGYLLEQNSVSASRKCVFKSTLDGEKTDYKPNEIAGYRFIDGKYYVSKQTDINKDQVKETVFMEFFIKGIACIYYYVDDKSEHFFVKKTSYGLVELSDPDLAAENADKAKSQYKGKLKVIMADCPEIVNEINNTQLNYSSLVKLSKDYHNRVCTTESCIIFERKPTPVKVDFGILIGTSFNKYKFGSELYSDYRPGFQVGVIMRLKNILFSNDKIGLSVGVLLEKDSKYTMKPFDNNRYVHASYNDVNYILTSFPLYYTVPDMAVDLKLISLKMPLMINYNFDFRNISIVPGIGITNKFVLSNNKQFKMAYFENEYGRTIQPYLLGFIGKIGFEKTILKTRTLCFNFSYEFLADPAAVNYVSRLTENNYTLQVGFRL